MFFVQIFLFQFIFRFYPQQVRNEFYKDSQGAILVFDVTKRDSFDVLSSWLDELRRDIASQSDMEKIVIAVCANKTDRTANRVVNESEGRLWAESNGFLYFETSAQSGEGIQEMFQVGSVLLQYKQINRFKHSLFVFICHSLFFSQLKSERSRMC